MKNVLSKYGYEEPQCLLNMHPEIVRIPIRRIIEKLDSCLGRNDYSDAERLLQYWLKEAEAENDIHGKLTILNEQIGLYRKMGKEAECLQAISSALSIVDATDVGNSVTGGTTLINAATGYNAFGKAAVALPLYRKARKIYETNLNTDDARLGGLYNNMAITLTELKEYREAEELFNQAMEIMKKQKNGELEVAITCLNLADLVAAEVGFENGEGEGEGEKEIEKYLQKAETLLNTEDIQRDGYYAFVCEKCAPVFGYYGYFLTEQDLKQRARNIYERA